METLTLLRLAEIPNIVAVKEASGNLGQISDVCGSAPEGFRVYSGDDGLTLPLLALGAFGIVSVAGHVVGSRIQEMLGAFFEGRVADARRIHHQLAPVFKALFSAPSPVPVKFALSLRGFDCESVRLPLVPLSDAEKAVVCGAMEAFRGLTPA